MDTKIVMKLLIIIGTFIALPLVVVAVNRSTKTSQAEREPDNIVFPSDAGVLNVRDFGAKGNGVTDDTAAIQALLNAHPNGQRIIYLPNGTYLVSKTITWPAGTGKGDDYKNTILQGQSELGVTIKLKDHAAGFTISAKPKPVIFTGPGPAQRFGNSIRTLTVDTGNGNLGAIGIQFNASNQGSVRQVTIQSGDGEGVNGLDLNFADEIGPLLVKNLTVNGFQYGIRTGFRINSQTFENITLTNQREYGLYNTGQVVNIRGLTSDNAVTAIYNAGGLMTLLDSSLTGTGEAASKPALRSDFPLDLFVRNLKTSGYQAAIQNNNTTQVGPTVAEFRAGTVINQFPSPQQTLNLPIQETPDVPWDDPAKTAWANVSSYGAKPNDSQDDTAAIQAAIDSGKTTVYFPVGTYNVSKTILIRNNVRRLIGTEATVEVPKTVNPGFKVVAGKHPIVVFERIGSGYNPTPTIENASSRTLVIRDATNVSGNMTGSGDVFIENVVSNPAQTWTFNHQNIWARQFNVENMGTHIINNGGKLWILGLKTERGGTLIDTKGGGQTELLGGLAYTTTAGPDGTQNYPMFINSGSSISITLGEVNYGSPNYTTYVRETSNGIARNLTGKSLSTYVGSGKHIPLYVGSVRQ
jgi:Pectate lyase superfamily protein